MAIAKITVSWTRSRTTREQNYPTTEQARAAFEALRSDTGVSSATAFYQDREGPEVFAGFDR